MVLELLELVLERSSANTLPLIVTSDVANLVLLKVLVVLVVKDGEAFGSLGVNHDGDVVWMIWVDGSEGRIDRTDERQGLGGRRIYN